MVDTLLTTLYLLSLLLCCFVFTCKRNVIYFVFFSDEYLTCVLHCSFLVIECMVTSTMLSTRDIKNANTADIVYVIKYQEEPVVERC